MRTPLLAIIIWAMTPQLAAAGLIYSESIDGDLQTEGAPTLVNLFAGPNDLNGTVGGSFFGGDGYDAFTFDVEADEAWTVFQLTSYVATPPNTTSGFNIWSGPDNSGPLLGSVAAGTPGTDLFAAMGIGPLGPGIYTVSLREFTSTGNDYSLRLVLIPEPAAWSLAVSLMGVLGLSCHRSQMLAAAKRCAGIEVVKLRDELLGNRRPFPTDSSTNTIRLR